MRRFLLAAVFSSLFSSVAFGWGCEGHQMVALIARAHLNPAIASAVDDLLKQNPVDPALNRFCKDRPDDPMADAATWPDDAKSREKTGNWHYVDIPRSVDQVTSLDPWCPPLGPSVDGKNRPGCITNAMEFELTVLHDKARPVAERATALRYIIHFVGDIHQPLHDEDNNDQGGNCTSMQFFSETTPSNLHAIWDYKLIQHRLEQAKLTQSAYAADLNARFAEKFRALSAAKPADATAWAWETHAVGQAVVYGSLDPGIPVETPDAQAVCSAERRGKVSALHITVGADYFGKAIPVIDAQLATAGFRLARLLNDTLR